MMTADVSRSHLARAVNRRRVLVLAPWRILQEVRWIMTTRAILIWLALLAVAIVNGGLRELVLVPWLGRGFAQAASTVLLSGSIAAVAWLAVPWIAPRSLEEAWAIGVGWVTLTLAFEFLGGRFLFGKSWIELAADYNLLAGRIWVMVLVVTLLAPVVAFARRGQVNL
jgi:hypothetical protein